MSDFFYRSDGIECVRYHKSTGDMLEDQESSNFDTGTIHKLRIIE